MTQDRRLEIRLTQTLCTYIEQKSAQLGVSKSDFVRTAIQRAVTFPFDATKVKPLDPPPVGNVPSKEYWDSCPESVSKTRRQIRNWPEHLLHELDDVEQQYRLDYLDIQESN